MHVATDLNIFIERPTCAESHDFQWIEFFVNRALLQIDIAEGIHAFQHNVNIINTNTGA